MNSSWRFSFNSSLPMHTILHITNLLTKSNVCCKSWIIIHKQIGLVANHSFHQCIICFALRFVVFIMIVKYVCTLICFIKIAADYAFYLIHYISTVCSSNLPCAVAFFCQ